MAGYLSPIHRWVMNDKSTKTISGSTNTGCLLFSTIVQGSTATDAYVIVSITAILSVSKYIPASLCFNGGADKVVGIGILPGGRVAAP
jgi:Gpi18-like mannosyltransferase